MRTVEMAKWVSVTIYVVAGIIASSGLAGAAAATRAVKPVKLVYRERRAAVAAASTGVIENRCPAAAPHGISGFFEAAFPPGPFLLGLSAPTRHGWAVGVVNTASTTRSFFGGEVCSSRSFAYKASQIMLSPEQAAGYTEQCPRSDPKPISGVAFPVNASPGDVIVAQSYPLRRGWATVLKILGADPQTYVIGVFCAPPSQHVVLLNTSLDTIAPHQIDTPKGICPRGAPHAIGGFFSPARKTAWGDIAVATSVPLGSTERQWGIIVTNLTSQPQNDVTGTVCLG